jgi:hypothetical protein
MNSDSSNDLRFTGVDNAKLHALCPMLSFRIKNYGFDLINIPYSAIRNPHLLCER